LNLEAIIFSNLKFKFKTFLDSAFRIPHSAFVFVNLEGMAREFQAGDNLIFQLESGFGLLRVLGAEVSEDGLIWHLSAFEDLFLDAETAEAALQNPENLRVAIPHIAMTNRAFERTPTARLNNHAVSEEESRRIIDWKSNPQAQPVDRSALQMLGLR
jgi:hypothetical protein